MEYTIQELSRLSGVTTRTLRWYDEIGLLKPVRRADSGVRCYGPEEVDRLQDILYYRALGVELARIRACLDAPSFDRLSVLKSHLAALEEEQERIQGLINSVKETIFTQERKKTMSDKKKFEAFKRRMVEENEEQYGKEARKKYGDAEVDQSNARIMGLTQEQYDEWDRLGREILAQLSAAVAEEADPAGERGREIAGLHRRWITITGNRYSVQQHRGLAELYVQDERFTAYCDNVQPGCARFLRDAVLAWVK